MMRLVPDVVRLIRRLAMDPDVPRATRWWLLALLGYLLLPIDVIPDFIPVLGFADDAIVIVIGLRFAIRSAGEPAIRRHWPGTSRWTCQSSRSHAHLARSLRLAQ